MNPSLALLALIFLSACGLPSQSLRSSGGIWGEHRGHENKLNYSAHYIKGGDIAIQLSLNEVKRIYIVISPYEGLREIDGRGHSLNNEEIALLKSTLAKIKKNNPEGPTRNALLMMTEYISEVPTGHKMHRETYSIEKTLKHKGIQCLNKGENYQAHWSLTSSQRRTHKVDDKACLGRCGRGCDSSPSNWTRDCLNLDACKIASQHSNPSLCGDEWLRSADDWAMGKMLGCQI
ncbi:hypothetical protein [Pseudobacteriovorax antillogorgiicola]|uniref:DUF8213 domain-containing protein n=1 Tax=Pseudobacteriovorax antillogorgiicola TaxID=1513793 RepID=A0A1Y6BDJ5_9BACT|nr:hypothetical protein [Pseudobacteriovorax antillogorgiicola]TCS56422.1 hypothetical protein EDD56_104244 [Pseudobacteriovorax antillogorgiicola]SMF05723.1 hypothetical protein SAMN06296036_10489 [Pseudobacteriovorax antillogorgiicola]